MRAALAAVATVLVLLLAPSAEAAPRQTAGQKSAPERAGPFASQESVLAWINRYRETPEPKKLADAVRAMSTLGLFRDSEGTGVYVGFIAGVLGSNPRQAEAMVGKMFPMPPEDQGVIIKAIAYSGLPDWKELLGKFVERMPARRVTIDRYLHGKGETLDTMPLDKSPAGLDTLWGYYFATGSPEPIRRILSVLPWAADKKDLDRLTIGGMAKWTLASNASRDKELLDVLRAEQVRAGKEIAVPLKDVVEAAQEFEVGRIRKQALAAIDELKAKGPQIERTWWQTAINGAPTAIGLACIAASVTGQVELGVPCVVTGALSTAAAKWWGSPAATP